MGTSSCTSKEMATEHLSIDLFKPANIHLCSVILTLPDVTWGNMTFTHPHIQKYWHTFVFLHVQTQHLAWGWFDWKNRFSCRLPTVSQPCVCSILCITVYYCTLGKKTMYTKGILCFKHTLQSVRIRLLSSGTSQLLLLFSIKLLSLFELWFP